MRLVCDGWSKPKLIQNLKFDVSSVSMPETAPLEVEKSNSPIHSKLMDFSMRFVHNMYMSNPRSIEDRSASDLIQIYSKRPNFEHARNCLNPRDFGHRFLQIWVEIHVMKLYLRFDEDWR